MRGTKKRKGVVRVLELATESQGNHSWASGQSSETVATKERKAVTSAGEWKKGADEDREATLALSSSFLLLDLDETNLTPSDCPGSKYLARLADVLRHDRVQCATQT